MQMTEKTIRKVFVRAGEPVGIIGGTDERYRREGDAFVVLPDERWGNPLFADACLDESDFHIHARLTLDRLTGSGASVLLGGHYHYQSSRPEGHTAFRICLDEVLFPANKSPDKQMHIVHGRTPISDMSPTRAIKPWWTWYDSLERQDVGECRDFFRPGEPFTVDIFRRGKDLSFEINGREAFRIGLGEGLRITPGRGCENGGWPINIGFLPGRSALRIHDFWAEGIFPEPVFPTADAWHFNTGGYNTYRIPSLCMISGGRLLAFAEAKRMRLSRLWEWELNQVQGETHCVMKSSADNGRTWSEQQVVIDRGVSYEARDPSPVLDRDTGEIFLFTGGGTWVVSSRDEGRTWSEPRSVADAAPGGFKNLHAGTANSAIQLRHGRFRGRLLAVFYAVDIIGLIFSDDHGKTWQPGALAALSGASEPTLVELSDGRVIVSPRMGKPPGRPFMFSHDGGASFAETRYEPAIPIVGRGGELLAFDPPDATSTELVRPIICCGPVDQGTRLTLMVSLDDCRTWPISRVIDDGFAGNLALVALPGRQVGVLYESDKFRRLSFQRVDLARLIDGIG
jgi:sialidase-1